MSRYIYVLFLSFFSSISQSNECDESCLRESAERKFGKEYASYLNKEYCEPVIVGYFTATQKKYADYFRKHMDLNNKKSMKIFMQFHDDEAGKAYDCIEYMTQTKIEPHSRYNVMPEEMHSLKTYIFLYMEKKLAPGQFIDFDIKQLSGKSFEDLITRYLELYDEYSKSIQPTADPSSD